ncbi:major_cap_HK97, phage major capsid protein, HK97 family [uncultured Caudovirales phage]|uniref:Major_cap_HK97, phage major capsid protein, HK97 family n=1 Tax=uncultured Caudovirales phage TaxID=2100421 RepID=A0A6J5M879_9CAUD|nr:major_cap_HK97, phage major capsid protein, HK97 family [uncultured Caudovirales phage]
MNIQQLTDAIRLKSEELEVLTNVAEPTSEDVASATKLNDEIDALQNQLNEAKSFDAIKSKNAARVKEVKTVVNQLPTEPKITVGESSAKANMKPEQFKSYVTGLFLGGLTSENARAKYSEVTGVDYKTHTQANDSTGGLFVPEETSSYIIDLKETYGVFRRNVRVEPMGSETIRIFRMNDDVTAYWGGEQLPYTESDMTHGAVTITAGKLTAMAKLTDEVNMNALINLGDRFAVTVARQFAKKEDEAGFNGDGTISFGGVTGVGKKLQAVLEAGGGTWTDDTHKARLGSAQVISGNLFTEATLADFVTGVRKLPTYALPGAKWFFNKVAFGASAERIAVNAGGVTAAEIAGSFGTRFLGYPVEFVDVMPSTDANSQVFAYFGDLGQAATLGDRMSTSIKVDTSLGFQTDTIYAKATQFVGIAVHDVGNYNATPAARVAGPIVGFVSQNS